MKKYLFIPLLLIVWSLSSQSQKINPDSIRRESLKNQLTFLKDSARVDCLNDLAREYAYYMPRKSDSAQKYRRQAYELSTKISYKAGIAMSLIGLKTNTDSEKNENVKKAIQIAEEINDYKILGWAYYESIDGKRTENYKKASFCFKKADDEEDEAEVNTWLSTMLIGEGKYEEAFPYCERNIILTKKKRTHTIDLGHTLIQYSLLNMSDLYKFAGDYETALDYLRKAKNYSIENQQGWNMDNTIGNLYNETGGYDSALYYLQKNFKANPGLPQAKLWLGETYLLKMDYDKAIKLFDEAIDSLGKPKWSTFHWHDEVLMNLNLKLAKAYLRKKNYPVALKYVNQSDDYRRTSKGGGSANFSLDRYDLLSTIYHNLNKNDSAYSNLRMYIILKDSLDNKKAMWRLNLKLSNYKSAAINTMKETQLALLGKDNKIKEQQIRQQATSKNFLVAVFGAFILIGIFVYRNLRLKRKNEMMGREKAEDELKVQQLESEKKQSELKQQAAELEMQALRAQMNPHFIFNCLSSINKFILKNETEAASDYLTRFSRLIRMVLINSQKSLITLEDELEMLRLYLDMERLRFKNSFEYNIHFKNTIDAGAIYLPPLLLQPFCENAIWHGLMHKDGQGVLDIAMTMQDNILNCTITDNGVGREMAAELNSKSAEKEKSLGLKITASRLELLNRNNGAQTSYKIEDLYDEIGNAEGTKVILQISFKEATEKYVIGT